MKHRSPNLALNAKYVQSNNRQGTFFAKIQFLPVHSIYFVLIGYGLKLKVRTFPLPLSLLKFSILLVACACSSKRVLSSFLRFALLFWNTFNFVRQ